MAGGDAWFSTDGRCEVVNQTLVFCYEEWFEGLEL